MLQQEGQGNMDVIGLAGNGSIFIVGDHIVIHQIISFRS